MSTASPRNTNLDIYRQLQFEMDEQRMPSKSPNHLKMDADYTSNEKTRQKSAMGTTARQKLLALKI
jgi:hypothetical protein